MAAAQRWLVTQMRLGSNFPGGQRSWVSITRPTGVAPGGAEQPLQHLRSRILARHTHAMLKRGVTLVTVYLEPGMRASRLNLWLLEVLAACILCFDGPWIAMGDWNLEPQNLSQAGGPDTVNGNVFASSAATGA